MTDTTERWRAIPGLEGYYDASSYGQIRSLPRHGRQGRIRKPYPSGKYKRLMVFLSVNGKRTNCYVGVLVARTFIGPRPPGKHVCHGRAGQADCSPGNLYYGTPKRNTHDRKRDGTWMTGEQNGRARLTWALAAEILVRCQAGESQVSLARELKVGKTTISDVVRGETWIVLGSPGRLVTQVSSLPDNEGSQSPLTCSQARR